MEIWKTISGYEGIYEVSNLGRVRSLNRYDLLGRFRPGVVLKPQFDGKNNYLHVNLNGKSVNVHRLVAKTFIDNPHNYKEVNHIDEDKTNNCASNLEWCDHLYNNTYGSKKTASLGENNARCRLSEKDIAAIRSEYVRGSKTHGLTALSKKYQVSLSHLSHILNGSRWGWLR